ncbi:hypothetical protein J6590_010889 [Homalodisca vitripennis]|nr:hypothetical protein J6590_010889 [Homalodisca vitripennis]
MEDSQILLAVDSALSVSSKLISGLVLDNKEVNESINWQGQRFLNTRCILNFITAVDMFTTEEPKSSARCNTTAPEVVQSRAISTDCKRPSLAMYKLVFIFDRNICLRCLQKTIARSSRQDRLVTVNAFFTFRKWGVRQATPCLCFIICVGRVSLAPFFYTAATYMAYKVRGQGIEQAGECRAVVGILGEGGITAAEGYLPHPARILLNEREDRWRLTLSGQDLCNEMTDEVRGGGERMRVEISGSDVEERASPLALCVRYALLVGLRARFPRKSSTLTVLPVMFRDSRQDSEIEKSCVAEKFHTAT